jgi:xanthine dehydrogenase YagT iron-sulfur-binding subunit
MSVKSDEAVGSELATSLTINGELYQVEADSRTSLLDYLRETLGLTGTKKGCDHGQCGACTIHIKGTGRCRV